jgi:hypothetical protein
MSGFFFLAHPAASPADWPAAAPKWGEDLLTLLVSPAVGSRMKHGASVDPSCVSRPWMIHPSVLVASDAAE